MASDGMKDLGNLPIKVAKLINRTTLMEIKREDVEKPVWENMVRFAFNHQDDVEMVMDSQSPVVLDTITDKDIDPVETEKAFHTASELRAMHYKSLQSLAKKKGVSPDGTKEEIIDRVMAAQV